jgi:hypothetical protein
MKIAKAGKYKAGVVELKKKNDVGNRERIKSNKSARLSVLRICFNYEFIVLLLSSQKFKYL